jgi:hypothetical protein
MAMDRRVRAATLIAGTLAGAMAGVILHARAPAAAGLTVFERLAADSAIADAAAFASLPRGLSTLLDLREELVPESLTVANEAECVVLERQRRGEEQRRLTMRLADSSTVVLFVIAEDSTGALERVEFIRRLPRSGQRGLTWDAKRDLTTSAWWTEPQAGVRRRPDRGDIPRGGPVPRALRALGRRLLTLPCEEAARTPR